MGPRMSRRPVGRDLLDRPSGNQASARRRLSAPKPGGAPKTVDGYFAGVPEPARTTLTEMRAAIRSAVPPGATEVISYGMPAFRGTRIIVWYAAFNDHCSLFPTGSTIEMFKDELAGFKISKGTIQFPLDKPLPIALIKKLVKARVPVATGRTTGIKGR